MKKLLKLLHKELVLDAHPTCYIFILLAAMLMIPNYPYHVTFFYTTLGIFFTCLSGRENNALYFSMQLPLAKRDAVSSRIALAVLFELIQLAAAAIFIPLRTALIPEGNMAGLDANLALLGSALVMMGIFNIVFFPNYFGAPEKPGSAFLKGSAALFFWLMISEASSFAVPFVRDVLDTPDPENLNAKLIVFACGAIIFAALTAAAHALSSKRFERIDL